MKQLIALVMMAAAAPAALACNDHATGGGKPQPAAKVSALVKGTVREVDADRGSIVLAHGPIPSLRMKPMQSMVIAVEPSASLHLLEPGDAVAFRIKVVEGVPRVSEIGRR
jgi:Cu/Ag efflux protein CusF